MLVVDRGGPARAGVPRRRRRFPRGSLGTVGACAAAAAGADRLVAPGKARAVEFDVLVQTLGSMNRALRPRDFPGAVHHPEVVEDLDVGASGFDAEERLSMLRSGPQTLAEAAGGDFAAVEDEAEEAALTEIAGTPFFEAVRFEAVAGLHDQPEVRAQFGHEGPSHEHGRRFLEGFDDLARLPDPPAFEEWAEPTSARRNDGVAAMGSGAGGGTLAHGLCDRGVDCVVLEAGAEQPIDRQVDDERGFLSRLAWLDPRTAGGEWRVARDFADPPAWLYKTAGGTTTHRAATG